MKSIDIPKGYFLRFYGNKASVVFSHVETVRRTFHVEQNLENARKKAYSGFLSKSSQNLIHKRLYAWMEACRVGNHANNRTNAREQVRLVFITLTLSGKQRHDDKWIKKNMLELFIKRLQTNYNVKHYFWKAEVQMNGNIHFHLIIDKYIDYLQISRHWNQIQQSHSYLDSYFSVHGHYNPPSTHVRELTGMWDGIGYAMKYVSKSENKRPIQGSIFRFSDSLINLTVPAILITHEYEEEWARFCKVYTKSSAREEYWTSYKFLTRKRGYKQPEFVARETKDFYLATYNLLYSSAFINYSVEQLIELQLLTLKKITTAPLSNKFCSNILATSNARVARESTPKVMVPVVDQQLLLFDYTGDARRFKS